MQGHTHIIAMRKQGLTPAQVFVNDYPCKTDWFEEDMAATVCTAGDSIGLLDFRFLVGLTVHIASDSKQRAQAIYNAVKAAGASRVGACELTNPKNPLMANGWVSIWTKETQKEVTHG